MGSHSRRDRRRSSERARSLIAAVDALESRKLFCALHSGVADVFDPSGRLPGDDRPVYTARVNFGSERTRAVPGYAKDTGDDFQAYRGNQSFGWTSDSVTDGRARKSQRSQDDRYDSFVVTGEQGGVWELEVPNGLYTVRIAAGDARRVGESHPWTVEGLDVLRGETTRQQRWLESTLTVAVDDGRLTLATSTQAKISFVDVSPAESQLITQPAGPDANQPTNARNTLFGVNGLTLINAATDSDIRLLTNGSTIDLSQTGSQLSVRAETFGTVKSVRFTVDGAVVSTENLAPYAIKSDTAGNYHSWTPSVGTHTLVATAYSSGNAAGEAGAAIAVTFTVVNGTSAPVSPPPAVPPPPTSQVPSASGISVNFQPSSRPDVTGYATDSGITYGLREGGQTFGWSQSHTDYVVARGVNSDPLLDTNAGMIAKSKWELAVPNGEYRVTLSVGDASASSTHNVWVEGQWILQYVSLNANAFRTASTTVTVTDGRLTIGNGSSATGATRLNYIQVEDATATSPTSPPASPPSVSPPVSPPPISPPVSPPPISPPPASPPSSPTSVSWSTVTPNPVSRAEAVGNVVNGKLYVMGGFNGKVAGTVDEYIAIKRGDVYNPATNRWTRIADMPEAFTHATGVVVGNQIWFVGGYGGNHPGKSITRVWKYDTVSNSWSRGPDLPLARGAGGAALIGNTIYFVGGMDRDRINDRGNLWALDLNNQGRGWVAKASMPTARNHLSVVALHGKLYAISGQLNQEQNQVALRHVEVYDPVTNTWSRKADIPAPRSHVTSAVFTLGGRIVVVGGEHGFNLVNRSIYAYDPDDNQWSSMGLLPAARSTMVAGALPDGRIIASTGNSPTSTTTTWIGRPN